MRKKIPLLLPKRKADSHKGDYGRLLIIAGSPGMSGAAILAGRGALRSGTGLVYLAVPKGMQNLVDSATPEYITLGLPETKVGTISSEAVAPILDYIVQHNITACVLGPGISQDPENIKFVQQLLPKIKIPLLVDADALNALSKKIELLKHIAAKVILTPHPGELSRLIGVPPALIQKKRSHYAQKLAKAYKVWVVLKGHNTVVSDPDGKVYVNTTGNPGMASGGVGDVLSGIIGGLLAQKLPITSAAALGVYLHGFAGDVAARLKGEAGLIASDIVELLPMTMAELSKHV